MNNDPSGQRGPDKLFKSSFKDKDTFVDFIHTFFPPDVAGKIEYAFSLIPK